ncbi:MAG: hypothetical protein K0B81_04085 [Candidatus Cloacimonetes bacterium]|nr:hypothetical protein [Candidatus Cloacimonadota bacterium]
MLTRKATIYGAIFLLLLSMGTLNAQQSLAREEVRGPDFYFAPLPSFNAMFSAIDYLEIKDYDLALEKEIFKVEEETFRVAFALGVITADAILATKGRNKDMLNEIAVQMINYAKFIGLSEEILKLADELQHMIRRDQWDELMESLEKYKEQVELSLYETRQYDLFTMMQLGGWTQGLNRTTYLLMNSYQEDKTGIIDQKGIINSLINNMRNIRSDYLREMDFYHSTVELYEQIRKHIYAFEDVYPPEVIAELHEITEKVKVSFR